MRKRIGILLVALLLSGCSGTSPQSSSSSYPLSSSAVSPKSSIPQYGSSSIESTPQPEDERASVYPEQAAAYLKKSLEGSFFVSFSGEGKQKEVAFPQVNYSEGSMSPDGIHVLVKTNAGGAGEARWSGYTVVSLTNSAETHNYNGEQWGYQDHIWLDENRIGFADGGVIGGQEDTWKSIQLFDGQYNPLDITLRTSAKEDDMIVGIGYDRANHRYVLAHAENKDVGDDPFKVNQLSLSVFDDNGTLLQEIPIPEEYQSLYSPNLRMLCPNNPLVTMDGHILIMVQKKSHISEKNYHQPVLLVISIENQGVQELPGGYGMRLSADGNHAMYIAYSSESSDNQAVYLLFGEQGYIGLQGLPASLFVDGYPGAFVPFDVVLNDRNTYIMAENYTADGESFCGLFYWDRLDDPYAQRIKFLQILPGRDYCNLAGVDSEGTGYVLFNGVVPESALDEDDRSNIEYERERILGIIGQAARATLPNK